jgi:septin family protein
LEKSIVDLQLREMSNFLESKFEDTFTEEMKVVRAPGVRDTHIHCVFLVLDPIRLDANVAAAQAVSNSTTNGGYMADKAPRIVGGLDEDLDLQVLRALQGKTTVVPVISKADTITTAHMAFLKRTVSDSLKKANLDPLEALGLDDVEAESSTDLLDEREEDAELAKKPARPDDLSSSQSTSSDSEPHSPKKPKRPFSHVRTPSSVSQSSPASAAETPYLPLSIISPDMYDTTPGPGGKVGRKFPWGFADPHNVEHCDFLKLKEAVFSEWRGELREASRELWYEGWRTSRLDTSAGRLGAGKSGRR